MSDDITSLQSRIATLASDEERLNRLRRNAVSAKTARRDGEKRTEEAHLATLDRAKDQQLKVNADKEQKFQDDLKREGKELDAVSKKIREDFDAETRHRAEAKQKLQTEISAREAKLRSIASTRP